MYISHIIQLKQIITLYLKFLPICMNIVLEKFNHVYRLPKEHKCHGPKYKTCHDRHTCHVTATILDNELYRETDFDKNVELFIDLQTS